MKREIQAVLMAAFAVLLAAGCIERDDTAIGYAAVSSVENAAEIQGLALERAQETELYAGMAKELYGTELGLLEEDKEALIAAAKANYHPEENVYTFLQGPKSWGEGLEWSGEWSGEYVRGNYFGNFGCGLCCMANIYSTLTDYDCSPWDMYQYARQVSGYSPTRKVGAIGWGDMKVTLRKSGFDTELCTKPETFEEFKAQMKEAQAAVVLVCSRNDDTYWEKTGGHYVNLFLYDDEMEEVFLADPGSPDRNRNFIPLKYAYDALKTSSQYQYLLVYGYSEEKNEWKQDGIDEAWVEP